jgi:hypothetical protein
MAQLQSFEHEIADTTTPGVIIDKIGFPNGDGSRRAHWSVPELGASCILHYYDQLRGYDTEEREQFVADQPHFLLHAKYSRNGRDAMLLVRFINGETAGTHGRRDERAIYNDDGRQVFGEQTMIDPDEASWICGILMREGEKKAWGVVPGGESPEEVKRQAFPPGIADLRSAQGLL